MNEDLDKPSKYCEEGPYIYDDGAFTIWKSRFGLWRATDREGTGLTSGLDKESVVYWAREHINGYKTSTKIVTNVSFEGGYKL